MALAPDLSLHLRGAVEGHPERRPNDDWRRAGQNFAAEHRQVSHLKIVFSSSLMNGSYKQKFFLAKPLQISVLQHSS